MGAATCVLGAIVLGILAGCSSVAAHPTDDPPTFQINPETGAQCLTHAGARLRLKTEYGEDPVARGLSKNNRYMFELYVSASGTTWTWLVTSVNGCSRIMSGGKQMEFFLPPTGPRAGL